MLSQSTTFRPPLSDGFSANTHGDGHYLKFPTFLLLSLLSRIWSLFFFWELLGWTRRYWKWFRQPDPRHMRVPTGENSEITTLCFLKVITADYVCAWAYMPFIQNISNQVKRVPQMWKGPHSSIIWTMISQCCSSSLWPLGCHFSAPKGNWLDGASSLYYPPPSVNLFFPALLAIFTFPACHVESCKSPWKVTHI